MELKERFEKAAMLIERLQSGKFKDLDEKMTLKEVYRDIHSNAQVDLACSTCVKFYLEMIEAYYMREYPKYLKSLEPVEEVETETVEVKKVSRKKK